MRLLTNQKLHTHSYLASFTHNGRTITNPTQIANGFCEYFTNIGPNLTGKLAPLSDSRKDFLSGACEVTHAQLQDIVANFNLNKFLVMMTFPCMRITWNNEGPAKRMRTLFTRPRTVTKRDRGNLIQPKTKCKAGRTAKKGNFIDQYFAWAKLTFFRGRYFRQMISIVS